MIKGHTGRDGVPEDIAKRRRELATVCRRLSAARRRVEELEDERNALMQQLRRAGAGCTELARIADLSPGRVSQIVENLAG